MTSVLIATPAVVATPDAVVATAPVTATALVTATPDPVTPPQKDNIPLPTSPSKSSFCFTALVGTAVTKDLLNSCAQLFSTNYGVWGEKAATISNFTKPGSCLV
jgi:hypothetical protein